MIKESTETKHAAIRAEYDRLLEEKYREDPLLSKYLSKDYFLEKIAANPRFDIKDISYLRKIINRTYGRKRGK